MEVKSDKEAQILTSSNDSDEKQVSEVAESNEKKGDFTVFFSRGFTEQEYQDVLESRVQVKCIVLNRLLVNSDGSLTTSTDNFCVTVKNGQVTEHASTNISDNGVYQSVVKFAPKFLQAGVKYIGFSMENDGWRVVQSILDKQEQNPEAKIEMYRNIGALYKAANLNMFDSDAENAGTSGDGYIKEKTVSSFFIELYKQFGIETFSCSPYNNPDYWINIAKDCYKATGKPLVKWWNLQTYDGGSSNTAGEWADYLIEDNKYKDMGLDTVDEAKMFIKTIVSSELQYLFDPTGDEIIRMIGDLRADGKVLGGAGIWQLYSTYRSNIASKKINWYELSAVALEQALLSTSAISKFVTHYQGKWKCTSEGKASFGYTYCVFNDYLLIYNNNDMSKYTKENLDENKIGYAVVSNIVSQGNGYTWNVGKDAYIHKLDGNGLDQDSYDGGIYWQKV